MGKLPSNGETKTVSHTAVCHGGSQPWNNWDEVISTGTEWLTTAVPNPSIVEPLDRNFCITNSRSGNIYAYAKRRRGRETRNREGASEYIALVTPWLSAGQKRPMQIHSENQSSKFTRIGNAQYDFHAIPLGRPTENGVSRLRDKTFFSSRSPRSEW